MVANLTLLGRARLRKLVSLFVESEEGQDMIEYGLLAALISIVAVAMIILVGPYLDNMFKDIANGLACMNQPTPC